MASSAERSFSSFRSATKAVFGGVERRHLGGFHDDRLEAAVLLLDPHRDAARLPLEEEARPADARAGSARSTAIVPTVWRSSGVTASTSCRWVSGEDELFGALHRRLDGVEGARAAGGDREADAREEDGVAKGNDREGLGRLHHDLSSRPNAEDSRAKFSGISLDFQVPAWPSVPAGSERPAAPTPTRGDNLSTVRRIPEGRPAPPRRLPGRPSRPPRPRASPRRRCARREAPPRGRPAGEARGGAARDAPPRRRPSTSRRGRPTASRPRKAQQWWFAFRCSPFAAFTAARTSSSVAAGKTTAKKRDRSTVALNDAGVDDPHAPTLAGPAREWLPREIGRRQ